MEAGDDHLSIRQHAQSMLDDVNKLVVDGTFGEITVDNHQVPMEFIVCLDLGKRHGPRVPLVPCTQDGLEEPLGPGGGWLWRVSLVQRVQRPRGKQPKYTGMLGPV